MGRYKTVYKSYLIVKTYLGNRYRYTDQSQTEDGTLSKSIVFRRKMAKRKIDSSLNDFVIEYLKKRKCERTLKLVEINNEGTKNENVCEKFMHYLKRKESENENENDDFGFEINFGAYQQHIKVH